MNSITVGLNNSGINFYHFSLILNMITVYFLNQVKGEIPRCGTIHPKTVNTHDLCYQSSIDNPDLFFGDLRII